MVILCIHFLKFISIQFTGYLNSALNPVIYTVFSNDFRTAFKRILARLLFFKMPGPHHR